MKYTKTVKKICLRGRGVIYFSKTIAFLVLARTILFTDGTVLFTEGTFFIFFCPFCKKNCPVSKKKKLRQFAYQNTYNEAIFDL